MTFRNQEQSHCHSLETLNVLYEYDDFMSSIDTMVDLGCGLGNDLEWWATRTTRDETPQPLNITCVGIDLLPTIPIHRKYNNVTYQCTDFEGSIMTPHKKKFDVLWCHDAFQYALNPIGTLSNWWNIANEGAMLILIVPQTINLYQRKFDIRLPIGHCYHYSLVNLIYMLSVAGWDCKAGHFLKKPNDSWLHAAVYRSDVPPMNPKTTSWYHLSELNLLPESADKCIKRHGEIRQQELTLPWLDKSLTWYGQH